MPWVYDLTQRNVKSYYENCNGWGWNYSKKRRELEDSDARYIIATTAAPPSTARENNKEEARTSTIATTDSSTLNSVVQLGQPMAFVHLRYEMEEDEPVLYVYEIQVESSIQGRGVGKFLMQLVEFVARRSGLARVMLTSFTENTGANALYTKLGYVEDDDSPGKVDPEGESVGYEILTKRFPITQK